MPGGHMTYDSEGRGYYMPPSFKMRKEVPWPSLLDDVPPLPAPEVKQEAEDPPARSNDEVSQPPPAPPQPRTCDDGRGLGYWYD